MSNTIIYPFGQNGTMPSGESQKEFLLAQKPQIRITKNYENEDFIDVPLQLIISHPLLYEGTDVEVVLMCYRKWNGKKYNIDYDDDIFTYHHHKKGWAILNRSQYNPPYFNLIDPEFSEFNNNDLIVQIDDLNSAFYETGGGNKLVYARNEIGIVLRIPNPEWDRQATSHKNAKYRGVPESLYGPISIMVNSSEGWGIKK